MDKERWGGPDIKAVPPTQHPQREKNSLTAVLLPDPLGAEDAEGAAGLPIGSQGAAQLELLVVVAAVQVTGLVEGEGIKKPVAGLKEALHVGELQAVAVTLHGLDVYVVTRGCVLGELELVATGGERSGQYARSGNSHLSLPTERKTTSVVPAGLANPGAHMLCRCQLTSIVTLGKSGSNCLYPLKKVKQF